jgi:hypothetical protein
MPSEVTFCRVDDTVVTSEMELCQKLAEAMGVPHSELLHKGGGQFAFGETGISVSLVLDEDRNPTVVTATLSHSAEIKHVTRLCRSFREMGWVF